MILVYGLGNRDFSKNGFWSAIYWCIMLGFGGSRQKIATASSGLSWFLSFVVHWIDVVSFFVLWASL